MALLWYFKKILQIALTQNGPQSQLMNAAVARAGQPGSSRRTMGPHRGGRAGCWVTLSFSGAPWPHFPQRTQALPPSTNSDGRLPGNLLGRSSSPDFANKRRGCDILLVPATPGSLSSDDVLGVTGEADTGRKDVLRFSSQITLLGSQRNLKDS